MGFCELLTIAFIVLKLVGVISWSWWIVLLPEIIAVLFYVAIIVFRVIIPIWELERKPTKKEIQGYLDKYGNMMPEHRRKELEEKIKNAKR
jgi:hypothetical protein